MVSARGGLGCKRVGVDRGRANLGNLLMCTKTATTMMAVVMMMGTTRLSPTLDRATNGRA